MRWIRGIAAVAIINFLAFLVIAELNGGTAANGYERGGRFFLGSHGAYRETTAGFFAYSLWHERAMWASMVLLALALVVGVSSRSTK